MNFEKLCTIIERYAEMNWYFQCSIVSLNFCKEYLNVLIFKITPDKEPNILRHHIQ